MNTKAINIRKRISILIWFRLSFFIWAFDNLYRHFGYISIKTVRMHRKPLWLDLKVYFNLLKIYILIFRCFVVKRNQSQTKEIGNCGQTWPTYAHYIPLTKALFIIIIKRHLQLKTQLITNIRLTDTSKWTLFCILN